MRVRPAFRVLLITDRRAMEPASPVESASGPADDQSAALLRAVRAAVTGAAPGEVAVMLREKDLPGGPLLALGRALRAVTGEAGAVLLVNDRVDVALAVGADGVHLPVTGLLPAEARRLLGPDALIGVSTHGSEQVAAAAAAGADYVTFGPVYDTPSKRRFGPPVGLEALRRLRTALPVYALGGIDLDTAPAALAAGAAGVACIRAVLAAADPAQSVRALLAVGAGAFPGGDASPGADSLPR